MLEKLEQRLADGRDDALLRFSLGSAYLDKGDAQQAIRHLTRATQQNPSYSAAWKLLGRALVEGGRASEAEVAWKTGIEVAQTHGDIQAAREMTVFLKRLDRASRSFPASMTPGSSRQ